MRLLAVSLLVVVTALAACVPVTEEEAPAVPETAQQPPAAAKPAAQEYSPIAFLDESLYVRSSELFYSPSGRMLKQAAYFAGTERVLALVTTYDTARLEDRAGKLYLVDTQDASQVFQLKGGRTVLSFLKAPDGSVYYHALEEGTAENAEEESEQEGIVGSEAALDVEIVLHRLGTDGEDVTVPAENALLESITRDGKLLLAHTSGVTPFGGYHMRGLTSRWSLYDPETAADEREFDYLPMLSPDLTVALDVVRNYDASDYENSYFALYQGTPGQPGAELRLVYSCPYFVTLDPDRWDPVVQFVDDKRVLLSRFVPAETPGEEEASVPNARGKLTLELFDLTNHSLRKALGDVSPHLNVLCRPGEQVFYYSSYTITGLNRVHSVCAAALDGSKVRVLAQNDIARRVRLMDVDIAGGKLLAIEDYETAAGKYSLLRELALNAAAPLPAPEEPETAEESASAELLDESAEPGPPPIMLPGERT